jgi:hypothetical protein
VGSVDLREEKRAVSLLPSMKTPDPDRLVLVYNAEDGFFNALTDWAHKAFSPSTYACALCRYTAGVAGLKTPWKTFLDLLPLQKKFFHRTEFKTAFPQQAAITLPVIMLGSKGSLEVLVSAEEIKATGGVMTLINLVQSRLEAKVPGLRGR